MDVVEIANMTWKSSGSPSNNGLRITKQSAMFAQQSKFMHNGLTLLCK